MLTDDELQILLVRGEADRVERKRDTSNMEGIRKAVCAFANDMPDHQRPGVLFIGVNDDGTPSGIAVNDQLLLQLADISTDGNVLPLPHITVQHKVLNGHEMAIVVVYPAEAPPVRYKGVVWIRTASRGAIASQQQETILTEKRRFRDVPFDLHPVSHATLEDIDMELFRTVYLPQVVSPETLARNHRTPNEQLAALRMVAAGLPSIPTVCGLLVTGRSPTDFIPGAYIQFVRVAGLEINDPISDSREIRGSLPRLLSELDDLLRLNIRTATDFTTASREIRRPDYPLVALQQIARNAVMHRSYENTNAPVRITWFDDRVEIQNPGGPFGRVTRDNFGMLGANDYRNSYLAEAMKYLGYVQRFGFGIDLARREMKRNGNPPPEFQVEQFHVAAILRKRP